MINWLLQTYLPTEQQNTNTMNWWLINIDNACGKSDLSGITKVLSNPPDREKRTYQFATKLEEKFVDIENGTVECEESDKRKLLAKIADLLVEHRQGAYSNDLQRSNKALIPVSAYMIDHRNEIYDIFSIKTIKAMNTIFIRMAANDYELYPEGMRYVRVFADEHMIKNIRLECVLLVCTNNMKHPEDLEKFEHSCRTIQYLADKHLLTADDKIEEEVVGITNKMISKVCLSAITNREERVDFSSLLEYPVNIIRVLCFKNPKFRDNLGIKIGLFVKSIRTAKKDSIILKCLKVLEVLSAVEVTRAVCIEQKDMIRVFG